MADINHSDERQSWPSDDDATMVSPRFDEREEANARPVVPLEQTSGAQAGAWGALSSRAGSRHLLLALVVIVVLSVVATALYRGTQTAESQAVQQPEPQLTTGTAATVATPQPVRREPQAAPARAAKVSVAPEPISSWAASGWTESEGAKREEPDEEELEEMAERARKEEKRRHKEEKKWREEEKERHEEAEKDAERADKKARKRAEKLRERLKDEGGARLIGVLTRKPGI